MKPSESGPAPWLDNGWQRRFGLLALLVGIGIGVLLLGVPRGMWGEFVDNERAGYRSGAEMFGERQREAQAAQPVPPVQAAPATPGQRGAGGHGPAFDRHSHLFFFFPFTGLRLIGPVLLIGAGAWLLGRQRPTSGGWNNPSGPYQTPPAVEPQPDTTTEPPATGETRQL